MNTYHVTYIDLLGETQEITITAASVNDAKQLTKQKQGDVFEIILINKI